MKTNNLLAAVSQAMVPGPADSAGLRARAAFFLTHMPTPIRIAFSALLWLIWLLAGVARRGTASQLDAALAWIGWLNEARTPLLHSVGLWLKAAACMIVLGDEKARRALYEDRGVAAPRTIVSAEVPRAEPAARLTKLHLDAADYIIIGSGPAGATVARTLAQAGCDVLLLEEGPTTPAAWSAGSTLEVLAARFRGAGTITTGGPARMPVLQGRGVGGSSVVNSAIAWRAPGDVLADWHRRDPALANSLSAERLARAYDAVEAALTLEATPTAALGFNNALMAQGAAAMGIAAAATRRYTRGCEGLGRCMEGCPRGHKMAMNLSFVPQAVQAGARLVTDCQVRHITFDGSRATGVIARVAGQRLHIAARRGVIVAASAIQTPILLRQSGVSHPALGHGFQAHPGASMAAIFDSPVRTGASATQGYDSIHFRESHRFKLETLTLPDELMASRFPGVGSAFAKSLHELPYAALWCAQVRARARGTVGGTLAMPLVRFRLTPEDERSLGKALTVMCEMFFAAGARAVLPGIVGVPDRVTSPDALRDLDQGVAAPRVAMIASHLFGTAALGSDKAHGVCDPFGQVHGVQGLFVADSSLFPTNLGVNPQHTIMAVAQHVAWGLLEERAQA